MRFWNILGWILGIIFFLFIVPLAIDATIFKDSDFSLYDLLRERIIPIALIIGIFIGLKIFGII